jgi:hypothetical protein
VQDRLDYTKTNIIKGLFSLFLFSFCGLHMNMCCQNFDLEH